MNTAAVMSMAMYTRETTDDGDCYISTGLCASPWNGKTQGGIPLAGLTAHIIDAVPAPAPMHVARLTIDIMGVVPMEPITTVVRVPRAGKRVQLIEVELHCAGRCAVRATALRVRTTPTPDFTAPLTRPLPAPPLAQPARSDTGWVETVPVEGDFMTPGPGSCWVRFLCPVVAGTSLSPLERMAMVSDWGSGMSSLLTPTRWTLANVDISLHLTRLPRGDWLLMDAVSESAGNGMAIANTRLADAEGMIGTAHQTVFLDHRPVTA